MRTTPPFWRIILSAGAGALVMCLAPGCKPKVAPSGPPKAAAPKTKAVAAATHEVSGRYASVFVELVPPKGKDPFYPNSHRRDPVPAAASTAGKPPPAAEVALKGIVGAANHRLAVVNNAILEVGETESVRVPGGRVKITCLEIGSDFAVVRVEGEIQAKRLELSKKGFLTKEISSSPH